MLGAQSVGEGTALLEQGFHSRPHGIAGDFLERVSEKFGCPFGNCIAYSALLPFGNAPFLILKARAAQDERISYFT